MALLPSKLNNRVPGQDVSVAVGGHLLRRLRVYLDLCGLAQRRHAQRAEQPRPLAFRLRLVEVDGEAVQELVRSLVEAPPSQSSEVAFVSERGDILSDLCVH